MVPAGTDNLAKARSCHQIWVEGRQSPTGSLIECGGDAGNCLRGGDGSSDKSERACGCIRSA